MPSAFPTSPGTDQLTAPYEPLSSVQAAILEIVARGARLEIALDRLCREVEARIPQAHCTATRLSVHDQSLRLAAAPTLPEDLRQTLAVIFPEAGAGTCALASVSREVMVAEDAATDPRWSGFSTELVAAGIGATISAPIIGVGLQREPAPDATIELLGTVALYYRRGASPLPDHVRTLELAAAMAATAAQAAESQAQVRQQRSFDGLTGLPNRRFFTRELERGLALANPRTDRFALLLLDLDHFKEVNETVGFAAGDAVLRAVAERLSELRGPADLVARLGDDDFAFLLSDFARETDVERFADRVVAAFEQRFDFGGQELFATATVGASLYPWDGEDAQTLLRNAEKALSTAKSRGTSRAQVYAASLGTADFETLELKTALRHAVEDEQLDLTFQPQIACDSGAAPRVEALVLWRHPSRGPIPPGRFIALAEATGMISGIGDWVLRHACRRIDAVRREHPDLALAVNVSVVQLREREFVSRVAAILEETGFPPAALQLEITESEAMTDVDRTLTVLSDLRALGVTVAIDDFGTGYSSLQYLQRFPIHSLKIDGTFVAGLPDSAESLAIVDAILAVGKALGVSIVAEGVETAQQASTLCERGCDLLQGYFFARPLAAEALGEWLADRGS